MKQFKRILSGACVLSCLMACALAQGAPTSQFGFTGWPYRATTSCAPAAPEATPSPAVTQAPVVTQAPIVTPSPVATPKPTAQAPIVTPAPATAQPTKAPGSANGTGDYTTVSVAAQEEKALNLLNADREANGLAALPIDAELSRIARVKACDMKTNNYFAHVSPTYGSASAMLDHFGYAYKGVGENIAHHATVEKAEAAFMSSSGHRTNILGSQWTRVGIGVCYDDNGFVYVTQLFAR